MLPVALASPSSPAEVGPEKNKESANGESESDWMRDAGDACMSRARARNVKEMYLCYTSNVCHCTHCVCE